MSTCSLQPVTTKQSAGTAQMAMQQYLNLLNEGTLNQAVDISMQPS